MTKPIDPTMYFAKCNECKQPMRSGHRSGTCSECRTVKCTEPDCLARVRKNINVDVYCRAHASKRKLKNLSPSKRDFGMQGI